MPEDYQALAHLQVPEGADGAVHGIEYQACLPERQSELLPKIVFVIIVGHVGDRLPPEIHETADEVVTLHGVLGIEGLCFFSC